MKANFKTHVLNKHRTHTIAYSTPCDAAGLWKITSAVLDYFKIHDVQTEQAISLNQQTVSQSAIMQSNNPDEK